MDTTRIAAQSFEQSLSVALHRPEGGTSQVPTILRYDSSDPYALTMSFQLTDGPVPWTFGRELLSGGLFEPSGDGDVHVWPGLDDQGFATVSIELCSPHGNALVDLRTADADRFVSRSHALVAPGAESAHVDVDALIFAITAAEPA
jgi:Streptomyces sporulation and cell division protein, SsgA